MPKITPLDAINKAIMKLKDTFGSNGLLTPSEPLAPITKSEMPRGYDYGYGSNTSYIPRSEIRSATRFESLDYLARNIDIVMIGLAYKRLQMATYKWNIVPVDPTDTNDYTKEIEACKKFFKKPDKKRSLSAWLGKQVYNYAVYDAITVFKRRDNAGRIYSLEVVDGKTIKPLKDQYGRRPDYPSAAFQQVIQGVPETNWTEKDIVYRPVNEMIDELYGCSAVENVLLTLNTYAREQAHELVFFTDGTSTSSGLLAWGTDDPNAEELIQIEEEFSSFMKNPKNRHRLRVVPKGTEIVKTMEFQFDIQFKEHLIKVMCASLNLNQALFISMLNRSTSQTLDTQQEDDMLTGELTVFEEIFSDVIQEELKYEQLKFEFDKNELTDPKLILEQAIGFVKNGITSVNEQRLKLGLKPTDGGDDPYVMTATGAYKIKDMGNGILTNMIPDAQVSKTVDKKVDSSDNDNQGV